MQAVENKQITERNAVALCISECFENIVGQKLPTSNNNCTESGFHFLVDHGTDEVVETTIAARVALFVKRCLRVGIAVNLCLKTDTVVTDESELFIGGVGTGFECAKQSCRAAGSLAKVLEMSEFSTLWRCVFIITRIRNDERFGGTGIGDYTVGVTDVFLALDEFVVAVKCAGHVLDGSVVGDFSHRIIYLIAHIWSILGGGEHLIAHIWSILALVST